MSEYEKMKNSKLYRNYDPEILTLRIKAHDLSREFNTLSETDSRRNDILKELFQIDKIDFFVQGPIQVENGKLTKIGSHSYINFNCTILDNAPINLGKNTFVGPNVGFYTPVHPFLAEERNEFLNEQGFYTDEEYALPITVCDNCWIASGVIICGGVTIGEGCVIGAGSVVTHDIPPHSFAAGNPCKVIREITEKDSVKLKKFLF